MAVLIMQFSIPPDLSKLCSKGYKTALPAISKGRKVYLDQLFWLLVFLMLEERCDLSDGGGEAQ